MKLHEVELALKKARAIAQAAGRQLKDKEQRAKVAEEKSHHAKLKFKQARKESRQARKAARRAREEADDARKVFTKATTVAAKAEARAAKARKKAIARNNKAKPKAAAKSPRTNSHRKIQLKPVPRLKPPGAGLKKTIVPAVKPAPSRQAASTPAPALVSTPASPAPNQDDNSKSEDASMKS